MFDSLVRLAPSRPRKAFAILALAAIVVWLAAGVVVYLAFPTWEQRGQFGDLFGAVNALFSGLAFGGVAIALLLQSAELAKEHEWRRRQLAHDLIFEASIGKFGEIRRAFECKHDPHAKDCRCVHTNLSAEERLQLDTILNYLENVCLAIKNNVVDEQIVYSALGEILLAYSRWSHPYVTSVRQSVSQEIWCEIDPYADRWERQTQEDLRKAKTAMQMSRPGKEKL